MAETFKWTYKQRFEEERIATLQELTGFGRIACKMALNETNWDIKNAIAWLNRPVSISFF